MKASTAFGGALFVCGQGDTDREAMKYSISLVDILDSSCVLPTTATLFGWDLKFEVRHGCSREQYRISSEAQSWNGRKPLAQGTFWWIGCTVA